MCVCAGKYLLFHKINVKTKEHWQEKQQFIAERAAFECLWMSIHISKVYKILMKFLSRVATCFVCIDVIKYGIAKWNEIPSAIAYKMHTLRLRFHFILSIYKFHRPLNYPQSFIPCILSIAPPTHRVHNHLNFNWLHVWLNHQFQFKLLHCILNAPQLIRTSLSKYILSYFIVHTNVNVLNWTKNFSRIDWNL